MTACNERPPEGHPFHGTLVACHLAAGHERQGIRHSWEIPDRVEPWAARFVGGPAAGDADRTWAVGPVWSKVIVAPFESPARGKHWEIVGGDGIPEDGRVPWDGEVTYLLEEIAAAEDEHLRWIAFYRWTRPPATARRDPDEGRYWGD